MNRAVTAELHEPTAFERIDEAATGRGNLANKRPVLHIHNGHRHGRRHVVKTNEVVADRVDYRAVENHRQFFRYFDLRDRRQVLHVVDDQEISPLAIALHRTDEREIDLSTPVQVVAHAQAPEGHLHGFGELRRGHVLILEAVAIRLNLQIERPLLEVAAHHDPQRGELGGGVAGSVDPVGAVAVVPDVGARGRSLAHPEDRMVLV